MPEPRNISIVGCGWLGLALAEELVQKGYIVKGTTTSAGKQETLRKKNIAPFLFHLDQAVGTDWSGFLESDVLIITVPPSTAKIDSWENFAGLAEKSVIKKIILISSTGIYHDCNQVIDEENGDPYIDRSGRLHAVEETFRNHRQMSTTILRLGGLIGYDRHPGRYATSKKIAENPQGRINLIHRDDAVGIIIRVIETNTFGATFLCCADDHPTKEDFYSAAARALDKPGPRFEPVRHEFKIISNRKVKETLNFEFRDVWRF